MAAAFAEPGHIVLVCGEAGVGKSSLVAAERAGAVTEVIEGSCLQLAGSAAATRRARADLLRARRLARGRRRCRAAVARAAAQGDPAVGRRAGAGRLGDRRPTVVIDDLQWADETTCDFLVYLASTAARRRLSLVLTLRDDETPRDRPRRAGRLRAHPAARRRLRRAAAAGPARRPASWSAALTGSDRRRRRGLVRADAGQPVPARRAGEGPRLPAGEGRPALPRAQRSAPTPPSSCGWPRSSGSGCPTRSCCRGIGPSRRAGTRRAVREAVDVGVLVVEGADYAFRHSLMCEAVLRSCCRSSGVTCTSGPPRRWRATGADDVVTAAAVSMHWAAAGDAGARRPSWSLRAARKARRLNAFAEAWSYYQRALEPGAPQGGASPAGARPRGRRCGAAGGDPAPRPSCSGDAVRDRRGGRHGARGGAGTAGLLPLGGRPDAAEPGRLRRGRPRRWDPRSRRSTPRSGARWPGRR